MMSADEKLAIQTNSGKRLHQKEPQVKDKLGGPIDKMLICVRKYQINVSQPLTLYIKQCDESKIQYKSYFSNISWLLKKTEIFTE